jgi:hypothetical protein
MNNIDRTSHSYLLGVAEYERDKYKDTLLSILKRMDGVVSRWRDISTAPKDGSHFLACDARVPYGPQWGFNQRPPTVVHWWGNPGEEGFYTSVNELEPQEPFAATHWQPLPLPPIGDGG